jgi:hypothetical protein
MVGLITVLALGAQQSPQQLKQGLEAVVSELQRLVQGIPPDPVVTAVGSVDNLQAALDSGGIVELQAGATFSAGTFTISRSGTIVRGHGATLVGTTGPALYIMPGVNDVVVSDLSATAQWKHSVVQCGDNSALTQYLPEQVPQRITFTNVTIPSHRGKRGFEINCAATLLDSRALDIWSPSLQDSQAIAILNTCGPVTVRRGEYVAASENIMVGGDTIKVQGCIQSDLTFEGITLWKPDEWRTDGIPRAVKNLFELKAGRRVKLLDSTLSGSWKASQDGWAVVVTPKNGSYIEDVVLDNVTVERVGGGLQILGWDYNSVTPQATRGIVVRNSRFNISKTTYGGRGWLALLVEGVLDVSWDQVTASLDGSAIVFADSKVPTGPWVMRNSRMPTGPFAVQAPGVNYGGVPPANYANRPFTASFEGNTFVGAPNAFKVNHPLNTYIEQ